MYKPIIYASEILKTDDRVHNSVLLTSLFTYLLT